MAESSADLSDEESLGRIAYLAHEVREHHTLNTPLGIQEMLLSIERQAHLVTKYLYGHA